jgi:hypothetical protein
MSWGGACASCNYTTVTVTCNTNWTIDTPSDFAPSVYSGGAGVTVVTITPTCDVDPTTQYMYFKIGVTVMQTLTLIFDTNAC